MSDAVTFAQTGGGRGLLVRRGTQGVAEFVFGLPDGAAGEADDLRAQAGPLEVALRQRDLGGDWVSELVIDNTGAEEAALPPLGMVVRVEPGWAGWSWSAETDGFVAVVPETDDGPGLLVRLRQGFLRAGVPSPTFAPDGRRPGALEPGMAAFFLANPAGALRGHARHVTRLEFGPLPDLDAARAILPAWVPELIARPGDEIRFETPDQALVPGPGARVAGDDIASVLTGTPGHRELAVHGPRGVTRLRTTFTPDPDRLAADVAAGLLQRRPAGLPTAAGAVVAAALARRAGDPGVALDWLEREDWLARADQFGPLIAMTIAVETHDEALGTAALEAVEGRRFGPGDGLIASWVWLGALRLGVGPLDLSRVLAGASTHEERFEAALIRQAPEADYAVGVRALTRRLGAGLPGQPLGVTAADAGLGVAMLRAVPEGAAARRDAVAAADTAAALLGADYADGVQPRHDGLAWLLWSQG